MNKAEHDYHLFDWWKKVVFKNYANFSGRARRAEYWNYVLANFLIMLPLSIAQFTFAILQMEFLAALFGLIFVTVIFGTIIPGLAVVARRLHDVNKSGWTYCIALIPLFGGLILLYYFVSEGDRGKNDYGDDPKMPAGQSEISQIGLE